MKVTLSGNLEVSTKPSELVHGGEAVDADRELGVMGGQVLPYHVWGQIRDECST